PPLCFTCTIPDIAPEATTATICVLLQLVMLPASLLPSHTWPLPCVEPKFVPLIVIESPARAVVGETLLMLGDVTVNATWFPHTPLCCTCALPLTEFAATVATICVLLQLTMLPAYVLPSHTWPLPCADPKLVPLIVTCVPGTPLDGLMLLIVGVMIVKVIELLHVPACCTDALPEATFESTVATICVSLQLTMLPASLLPSHTLPLPCTAPKPVPVSVTCVPGTPLVGLMLVSDGDALFAIFATHASYPPPYVDWIALPLAPGKAVVAVRPLR